MRKCYDVNSDDKISFSIVVSRKLRERARPKEYWKDLGSIFVEMAQELSQERLEEILKQHPLGSEIIEVLPE